MFLLEKIKKFVLEDPNIGYELYKLINPEKAKIVKLNGRFKNKHQGKRCFIIGNGPSLKDENLSLLKDEYVFTVNQFSRYSDYKKVKTNYHFWADSAFFDIDLLKPEDTELLKTMTDIAVDNNRVECFFPLNQKKFIEKYQLENILNVNYFRTYSSLENRKGQIGDLSKCIAACGTVVQFAIEAAIYMGFSHIYMLGCDNTGIVTTVKSALRKNDDEDYMYQISENEKRRMESLLRKHTLEDYVRSYLSTLIDYRILYEICKKNGITLVNCSSTTVIDSIPKMRMVEILRENR